MSFVISISTSEIFFISASVVLHQFVFGQSLFLLLLGVHHHMAALAMLLGFLLEQFTVQIIFAALGHMSSCSHWASRSLAFIVCGQ